MPLSGSLRAALVDRLAAQWIAVGVTLAGPPERTIVDLEALVGMTAELGDTEPRILETAIDWCVAFGAAVHGGRLRSVAAEMGVDPVRLGAFAAMVAEAGGPRWPMATRPRFAYQSRGKVHVRDLSDPARLAWRLRSAFGVNARADIVAALVSRADRDFTLADLARLTRFTKRNIAVAAHSLALAGVVEQERVGNEHRVRVTRHAGFREWLGRLGPELSVDWVARYAVAVRVLRFVEQERPMSVAVRAVEARALVEKLMPAIRRVGLPEPDTTALGEQFAGRFDAWIDSLAAAFAQP